jgi:BirA family biotin operon repressor/biotin-[acetyl-CoA-carboxylase] ligase
MIELPIKSPWEQAPILFKQTTNSTMADAKKLIKKKEAHGTVILTDFQKQGRGRFSNHNWQSSKGKNLLFTLILKKEMVKSRLSIAPLLVGLALHLTFKKLHSLHTFIKWPNDLLYQQKKLAGILCETEVSYLLIGVGVNCNQKRFKAELAKGATSIMNITHKPIDRHALLLELLNTIKRTLLDSNWQEKIERVLYLKNKQCRVCTIIDGKEKLLAGEIYGLDETGALILVLCSTGEKLRILSGSIITSIGFA